jgi:tRNA threonylcarbamoyl adenosine modification protein YeaZ
VHVLVIDTSSAAVTAAVAAVLPDVQVLAERVTINPRGHGELLAPSIRACLQEAGVQPDQLGCVVAGVGPGPFTGLRVGLVTAAVFAETLNMPAYGVCSLDAIGAAVPDEPELLVVTGARRREVYWARYRLGARVGEPAVARAADVPLDGLTAVAGAGAALYEFGVPVREVRYPPASELATLAAARIRAGAPADALTPLYLRRPDAVANLGSKPVSR